MPYADDERRREYHRLYREAHRENARAYQKLYRQQNPDKIRSGREHWQQTKAPEWKEQRRLRRHEDLVECAICHRHFAFLGRHLKQHRINTDEYSKAFPNAALMTTALIEKRSRSGLARAQRYTYEGKEPDRNLFSFLTGTLLGDGSLECCKRNARYADASSNELYAEWKYNLLKAYFPCALTRRKSKPHKKTGKEYVAWFVRTCVHPLLTEWHNEWYAGQKHISQTIVKNYLDAFALAMWYFDDGCNGKGCLYLYTLDFEMSDVQWLAALLLSRFGLSTTTPINKRGQVMIRIRKQSKEHFLELVRPYVVPGMEYKIMDREGVIINATSATRL